MDREQELSKLMKETTEKLKRSESEIMNHLLEYRDEWKRSIEGALEQINQKVKEQQKFQVAYLQFSVLRIDLIQKKQYHVLLTAYDQRWYLDPEAITVSFVMKDWFSIWVEKWELAYPWIQESMGKLNRYDVDHLVMGLIMGEIPVITSFLRMLLKDIETKEVFKSLPICDEFQMRYGEYRDMSELLLKIEHTKKTQKQWEKEIRLAKVKEDQLIYSSWYCLDIIDSKAESLQLAYIRFEECTLTKVSFHNSVLLGARFLGCKFSVCQFQDCDLRCADFSDSEFDQVDFSNANLEGAIFNKTAIPYLSITPEQLQTIQIKQEEKV